MWIQRTPKEIESWHTSTKRDARFQGFIFAGGVWFCLNVILAASWIAGGYAGLVAQDSVTEVGFWRRFPIFAVAGFPVAYWLFKRECKKETERAGHMTICPKCERAGENNEGQTCGCGSTFVAQSGVRWVDDEEKS
jgi:hypothetical protein